MSQHIKQQLIDSIINYRGFTTKRKIVVFESDDWGSIRMPSVTAFEALQKKNSSLVSLYDSLDALEKREDIVDLFDLLSAFKDDNGHSAKFTFNTVLTNPGFDKIKASGFEEYFCESFVDSYEHYYGEYNFAQWKQGMEQGLMTPQYHALQHFHKERWMHDLREGFLDTRLAFDYGFFGLKTKTSSPSQNHYLATYYAESEAEITAITSDLKTGLHLFRSHFGFNSNTFIASNYTWPKEIEKILLQEGIRGVQGQYGQIQPILYKNQPKTIYHHTGQRNELGQIYMVRNVTFEPYQNQHIDWVDKALAQVTNAFFFGKPAIICSHRINYVSHLNQKNKDVSLQKLRLLISKLVDKYPDIEFLDTSELHNIIQHENSHS